MAFLENIKHFRVVKGLKQADIAVLLNMDTSTYCRMEKGKSQIHIDNLPKLAEALGRSIDTLFRSADNSSSPNLSTAAAALPDTERQNYERTIVSQQETIATQKERIAELKEQLGRK